MITKIYNEIQFTELINQVIKEVVTEVTIKAEKLLKQHINTDTYRIGRNEGAKESINKFYLNGSGTPSYEFRDIGWDTEYFKTQLQAYAIRLFYNPSNLSKPSEDVPMWHGLYSKNYYSDARENLADYLNINGRSFIGKKKRLPFWDRFLKDLASKLGKWMYSGFRKRGLIVIGLKDYKFNIDL